MQNFLISEKLNEITFLCESKDNVKEWYLDGIYGESEIINKNTRFYPKHVMTEAVEDFNKRLEGGFIYGEWPHPKSLEIDKKQACIRVQSLRMDETIMMGRAKVLRGTTLGNQLIALLEEGDRLGVSTRSAGNLKEAKGYSIVEAMKLITVDVVGDTHSSPNAVPNAIYESVDWLYKIGSINSYEAELLEHYKKNSSSDKFKDVMHQTHKNIFSQLDDVVERALRNIRK